MSKKLDKLKKQMEKLQADIAAEQNRIKKVEAKERNQKSAIIGQFILDRAEADGTLDQLDRQTHNYITVHLYSEISLH